jgi:sortase A
MARTTAPPSRPAPEAEPTVPPSAARPAGAAPPRRGRRLLSAIGSVLVLVGAFAVGYAFYGLVLTDVSTHRAQARLVDEFEARVVRGEGLLREPPPPVTEETPTVEGFDDPNDVPVLVGATLTGVRPELLQELADRDWVFEASPPPGEALGRIVIPRAGVDWIVVEGVRPIDLRKGPGRMRTTAMPGQLGNSVISGHRTTYGAPFGPLDVLEPGDQIIVHTVAGVHTYEVVSTRIVAPTEMWVTEQWDGAWLTLVTCHPRFSSRQRLVVFSRLVAGPNHEILESALDVSYDPPQPPSA